MKLAIFDLDGTILDTLEDLAEATNYALRENGYPERSLEEIRGFVGNGAKNLIIRAVPVDDTEAVKRVYETFTLYYSAHTVVHTAPYPGILNLLRSLREQGILTAVVSNKPDYGVQTLCEQFFPGLFDYATGEREGIRRKPAPDSCLAVMDALHVFPADAVYIGDSDVDIDTARNAGMPCISVSYGFRSTAFLLEHGASAIAATVEELGALLGA